MHDALTPRQQAILDFIKQHLRDKGFPPAVREIGQAVGLSSSSTVHAHLNSLEKKGYLQRDPLHPRAIAITDGSEQPQQPAKEMVSIPIVGQIAAGSPILAEQNIEDVFPLPQDFLGPVKDDVFILTVSGESMIDAGILDGDYILVEKTPVAKNGQIVAALVDDEATVKRFFREKDHIRLQPENKYMAPIIVPDAKILGRVIGVFRRIH